MSYRRFLVLLGGLSTSSRFLQEISHNGTPNLITDPAQAERAFLQWVG